MARAQWTTTLVTLAVVALVGFVQRIAFVRAVKRERIAGWVLRDTVEEDARLPAVASFFHSREGVLERVLRGRPERPLQVHDAGQERR